jgi:hypothetical protein
MSEVSSSMKMHDNTTTGSTFPLSARTPIINAVNGI